MTADARSLQIAQRRKAIAAQPHCRMLPVAECENKVVEPVCQGLADDGHTMAALTGEVGQRHSAAGSSCHTHVHGG